MFVLRRENEQAARDRCRAQGLSYARTVAGFRNPTPEEIAAGCTRGAGPRWQRVAALARAEGAELLP